MGVYLVIVVRVPGRADKLKGVGPLARSIIASAPEIENCKLLHETLVEATLCFETDRTDWSNDLAPILEERGVRLTYAESGDWLK